jgi:hypothetical protein
VSRHSPLRALVGIAVLALAVFAALLSRGVAEAAKEFRDEQARWQRGVAAKPAAPVGPMQEIAENLLGIRTRSEVMRAYLDYRSSLAATVEGAVFPQTQARWNAIRAISSLRPSLRKADRAKVDVVLGVVYARSAAASGPQRSGLLESAVDAFTRGVLEDPGNADAKHDLELLLASTAQPQPRVRSEGTGRRNNDRGPEAPSPHTQAEGTGY